MKKIIAIIMLSVLLFSLVGCKDEQLSEVQLTDMIDEGVTESGIRWQTDGHTLVISGDGPMDDYKLIFNSSLDIYTGDTPWKQYSRRIKTVYIGEGVTSIGKRAFYGFKNLNVITVPSSVTTIGSSAFWGCKLLSEITIPSNVTAIADWAFFNCAAIETLTIPENVTTIGNWAFSGWKSEQTITINGKEAAADGWSINWMDGCSANIVWNP